MSIGIVVLDKPSGLGSNAVLSRLKHLLGEKKMGFLGTLDPLASGVLPVFVGKATRLIWLFEGLPKTYRVTMKLGERTDTFDAAGTIIERRPLADLTEAQVRAAILGRNGKQQQAVPSFSAVKVQGVPAYKLARAGEPVPERVREVELWDLAVENVSLPEATFRVTCTAGTYVRSLVEDLGLSLGPGAHVTVLRRLACGPLFTLENSATLAGIVESLNGIPGAGKSQEQGKKALDVIRNPAEFLPEFKPLVVTADMELWLRNGRTVPLEVAGLTDTSGATTSLWTAGEPVKALRADGSLVATGEVVGLSEESGQDPKAVGRGPPVQKLGFRPTRVLI